MKPKEYILSAQTSAEIEQQLRPFLERKINGIPLAEWLMRPERKLTRNDFIPPDIRIAIAATLENILATTGGPEELKLLEALDGILHGGGKPAIVIHGLPTAQDIAPILREAFRQKMFPDTTRPYQEQLEIKDTPNSRKPSGFDAEGTTYFHMDAADVGLVFGECGGTNPRHTEILTIAEFIEQMAAMMKNEWPEVTSEYITNMLKLPIWRVEIIKSSRQGIFEHARILNKNYDAQRIKEAQTLGLIRTGENGKTYAPIIYPNPNYQAKEEDSQPYKILNAPFTQLSARLKDHDHKQVTGLDDWRLLSLSESMDSVLKSAPDLRKGPVIKEGDLLVFNNRVVLHSGGGFVHTDLPEAKRDATQQSPRTINTLDVQSNPFLIDFLQPKDSVTKPIRIGTVDKPNSVGIDPKFMP